MWGFLSTAILFLALLISGCAASSEKPFQVASELVNDPSKASVWIYWQPRPNSPPLWKMHSTEVVVDGKAVGTLQLGQHALLALKPGSRTISLRISDEFPLPRVSVLRADDYVGKFPFVGGTTSSLEFTHNIRYISPFQYIQSNTTDTEVPETVRETLMTRFNQLSNLGTKSGRAFVYIEH